MQPASRQVSVALVALRFGHSRGRLPPLGALSLAGALSERGIAWELIDGERRAGFSATSLDEFVALVERIEADVIGFSAFHDAIPLLVVGLEQLAPKLRNRRIMIGGPAVVGIEQRLLARVPALEAVITGEAETLFPDLVDAVPGALGRPGLAQRGANWPGARALQTARPGVSLPELGSLPEPAWWWCAGKGYCVVPLSMMRGCPFACSFCEVEAHMGRRVRRLDPAQGVRRLERALAHIDGRHAQILDDAFALQRSYCLDFCRELRGQPWRVSFEIFARPGLLDEVTIEALAAAGCCKVYLGLDAGDDELLARVTHRQKVADAVRSVRAISRHIPVEVNMMWGYPFETLEQFARTLELCAELPEQSGGLPVRGRLHLLQPSVGTALFAEHGRAVQLRDEVGPLRQRAGSALLRLIADDPILAAAFYRYATPDYAEKVRRLRVHEAEQQAMVGRAQRHRRSGAIGASSGWRLPRISKE